MGPVERDVTDLKRCDRCGAESLAGQCEEVTFERRLHGKDDGSLETATFGDDLPVHDGDWVDLCIRCRRDLHEFLLNLPVARREA